MRKLSALLAAVAASAVALAAAPSASPAIAHAGGGPRVAYAFTVVAPRSVSPSQLVARAILDSAPAACPDVAARTRSGKRLRIRMTRLPAPEGSLGFTGITVCRAPLPRALRSASVGGRRLPLLPAGTPQRIVLFGDTGCRIQVSQPQPPATEPTYQIQDCNSPTAWPLERIAGEIAAAKPDLVVDTGDFFYREADCPTSGPDAALCAGSPPVNPPGSPNEDTWAGWEADWFRPARALFPVAPLVLARGNHESCERAGTGYFLLLEPGVSPPDTCQRVYTLEYDPAHPPPSIAQPTWVARLGSIDLVMLDSANASDTAVENAEVYTALGQRAAALLRSRATGWLLTHRPVYGWERFSGPSGPPVWTSVTMAAALDAVLRPFAAILSGHLHLFETVQIPGRPAQLVLGDGGTRLDRADQGGALPTFGPLASPDGSGPLLGPGGQPVAPGVAPVPAPTRGTISFTFGWMLLRPAAKTGVFTATRYEAETGVWGTCRLAPRSIGCTPASR
jgi:hypothetical protein